MAVITVNSQDHNREFDLTYSSDEPTIGGGSKSFELFLGGNNAAIPDQLFADNLITNVESSGVESIGVGAFEACESLKSAIFPKVSSIGMGAFAGCVSLKIAKFELVNNFGSTVFNIQNGIGGDIFIGTQFETMKNEAFSCPGYTIHMTGAVPPNFLGNAPFGETPGAVTLAVPESALEAYRTKFGSTGVNIIVDTTDYSTFDWTTV